MNQYQVIGNLGKDPETRTLENGNKVCTFSVATTKNWKDKSGEKQTKTTWHNVVIWGKLAEICEKYLKKGSKVYVSGEFDSRSYEDKEGVKRYTSELLGSTLEMLDSKPSNTENVTANVSQSRPQDARPGEDDEPDLPF